MMTIWWLARSDTDPTVQVLKLVEKHDAKINQALTRLEALEERLGSLLAKHDA